MQIIVKWFVYFRSFDSFDFVGGGLHDVMNVPVVVCFSQRFDVLDECIEEAVDI